jgi:hypothetical protein
MILHFAIYNFHSVMFITVSVIKRRLNEDS